VGNSGNFRSAVSLIWGEASPFHGFLAFSDWVYQRVKRTDSISLNGLAELIFAFLTEHNLTDEFQAAEALISDFRKAGRKELPEMLRKYSLESRGEDRWAGERLPKRQARHA